MHLERKQVCYNCTCSPLCKTLAVSFMFVCLLDVWNIVYWDIHIKGDRIIVFYIFGATKKEYFKLMNYPNYTSNWTPLSSITDIRRNGWVNCIKMLEKLHPLTTVHIVIIFINRALGSALYSEASRGEMHYFICY